MSLIFMRLFTFYFSDQVALLYVLLDFKSHYPVEYKDIIAWIDIKKSSLVNLDSSIAKYLWYPKGQSVRLK